MSNLKKVLKAGFLVTASFLATGCGVDNKDPNAPKPAPAPSPAPMPDNVVPARPASVATVAADVGKSVEGLKRAGVSIAAIDAKKLPVNGAYDVFGDIALPEAPPAAALSAGAAAAAPRSLSAALVALMDLKMNANQSLSLDSSKLGKDATGYHLSGLVVDGNIEGTQRNVANAKLKGTLTTRMAMIRNAVLTPEGAAVIEAPYAYVAIDAALGYPHARQDKDGKAIVLPADVHAIPAAAGGLALAAKTKGTAKASPATQVKGVDGKTVANNKSVKDTAQKTVTHSPKQMENATLVLRSVELNDQAFAGKLEKAGLHVYGEKVGAFDIAGRVSIMETGNTVVTSVNGHHPELDVTATTETAAKNVAPTSVQTVDKTKTGKTTSTAKKLALAAKTKSQASKTKSATPQAKANHEAATKGKPAVKQTIVDGNFLFQLKPDFYAEIGKWTVNAGTELHAMPYHSLVVHELDLKADLGIRVFAEEHGLDKLDANAKWTDFVVEADPKKRVDRGQEMMKLLVDEDHAIHESDTIEQSNVKTYQHFDSHTPFALWVVGDKAGVKVNNKKMVLTGVDLDTKTVVDGAGIYMMPLVKDFTGQLPNSSGKTKISIAAHDGTSTLEVSEWKIMSNGYNDYVVLMQVAARATAGLGAGTVSRALMSSKAQDGRSVLSSQLDRVVERLNPTHLIETSFANVTTARINQAVQFASLARGLNVAVNETLGAVEQYAVSFNHEGTRVGFTYNLDGGNAFTGSKGATSMGVNVASDVLGVTAIVSADASVDAAKNAYTSASHAAYNAGLTLAKNYSLGGVSVVPMAGVGFASNAISGYSAVVPMAAGSLGLHMNDVSFSAATFHAGVNVALDGFVSESTGTNASVAFGLAGYLASTASATLSTNEGKSESLKFGGSAVTPYAQFNLGFASGEKINAMISSNAVAVNFGLDR